MDLIAQLKDELKDSVLERALTQEVVLGMARILKTYINNCIVNRVGQVEELVKGEIKEEMKKEIKDEMKKEIKEEMMKEIKEEMMKQIKEE